MNSISQLIQKIKTLVLILSIILSALSFAVSGPASQPDLPATYQPADLAEALDHSLRHGFHTVDWQVI